MYPIIILPELQALIPPLTPQEYCQLETNLLKDGCREPLSVMEDVDERQNPAFSLLDGHNRHAICEAHGLPYKLHVVKGLLTREDVHLWIIHNQLGRRNLTEEQVAYYRGERYRAQKCEVPNPAGRNQYSREVRGNCCTQPPEAGPRGVDKVVGGNCCTQPQQSVAQRLAGEHGVSPRTVKGDAKYAEAVNRLVSFLGPEFKRRLLAHKTGLTKKDVLALASIEDRRLQCMANAKMDPKRCARTVRREIKSEEEKNRPIPVPPASMDAWCSCIVEAKDALINGDQDSASIILDELLDQMQKSTQQNEA